MMLVLRRQVPEWRRHLYKTTSLHSYVRISKLQQQGAPLRLSLPPTIIITPVLLYYLCSLAPTCIASAPPCSITSIYTTKLQQQAPPPYDSSPTSTTSLPNLHTAVASAYMLPTKSCPFPRLRSSNNTNAASVRYLHLTHPPRFSRHLRSLFLSLSSCLSLSLSLSFTLSSQGGHPRVQPLHGRHLDQG